LAIVTRSSIISRWQVCASFTQAMIEQLLLSGPRNSVIRLLFAPRRSHASILTCENGIGTGNWHRETVNIEWLNIKPCNFIYIEYITKKFWTLKWDLINRNIDPCDFEVSRFNCIYNQYRLVNIGCYNTDEKDWKHPNWLSKLLPVLK